MSAELQKFAKETFCRKRQLHREHQDVIKMMVVRIPVSESFLEFLECQEGITISQFCITEWHLRGGLVGSPTVLLQSWSFAIWLLTGMEVEWSGLTSGNDWLHGSMRTNPQWQWMSIHRSWKTIFMKCFMGYRRSSKRNVCSLRWTHWSLYPRSSWPTTKASIQEEPCLSLKPLSTTLYKTYLTLSV